MMSILRPTEWTTAHGELCEEKAVPRVSPPNKKFALCDDDQPLLEAAKSGDREALELLLTRHEASLLRLCAGIFGAQGDAGAEAADAVQETFLRALRVFTTPKGFRGESTVRTYLFRIAIRVCLEWRRQRKHLSLTASEAAFTDAASLEPQPEALAIDRVRIAEALQALQPRQRTLLILREQEELSAREIGALMGWNEKRVHNELFKTRQRLLQWRRLQEEKGGEE